MSSHVSQNLSETKEFTTQDNCQDYSEPKITVTRGEPRILSSQPDKSRSPSQRKVYGEDRVVSMIRSDSKPKVLAKENISESRKTDILTQCQGTA